MTTIILLERGYMVMFCANPWMPEMKRHWVIKETIKYDDICLL